MVEPISRWGRCWSCMPPYQRECDRLLAEAKSGMVPGVPTLVINTLFLLNDPVNWEWKLAAYVRVRRLMVARVPIGDGEADVYLANRAWMDGLWVDVLRGAVPLSMPFPCERLAFKNLPE